MPDAQEDLSAEVITKAALDHALWHIRPENGYAVLTAFSASRAKAGAHDRLKQAIRDMGLGLFTLVALFEGGEAALLLVVPGLRSDKTLKLAARFGQTFVLWADEDGVLLLDTDGSQERLADKPTPENVADIFSCFAPARRAFKGLTYSPKSWIDAVAWDARLHGRFGQPERRD